MIVTYGKEEIKLRPETNQDVVYLSYICGMPVRRAPGNVHDCYFPGLIVSVAFDGYGEMAYLKLARVPGTK